MPSFFQKLFGKKSKKDKQATAESKQEPKQEEKPKEEKQDEPKQGNQTSPVTQEQKPEAKKEEKPSEDAKKSEKSESDHKEKEVEKPKQQAHEQKEPSKPAEEKKEEIKKEETPQVQSVQAQKTESGKFMRSIDVDPAMHKYIIGTKGATIQDIQSRTNSKINIPKDGGNTITVEASSESEVDSGIEEIKKVIAEQNAKKDQKEQEYKLKKEKEEQATAETDILYKKFQQEVDEHAKNRSKYHEEADKAFEDGNKELGHQLREKAKEEGKLMEEAQKKASRAIFDGKNKDNDKFTMDLHGLHTKDALEIVVERITELRSEGHGKLCIIYGAGNHSDENGPKIKPAVVKYLNEQSIKFSEINNGSIDVEL